MLFADSGLSDAQISSLLLIWTAVGILAEVPSGALADRFSRRGALAAAGVFQAAGYGLWTAVPGYPAFAAGFVLWGIGGAFGSGALEALLYDGLASVGGEAHYPRLYARVTAVSLLSQLPTAATATLLFTTGGYPLVGWASVACCLAAAAVATRLPESRPAADADDAEAEARRAEPGLPGRAPGRRRRGRPQPGRPGRPGRGGGRSAGLDAVDEYFPLLAHEWGVTTPAIPVAMVAISLAGAAGAALGWPGRPPGSRTLAASWPSSVGVFCAAALVHRPLAVAGMALAYGLYRLVLVVTDARLQHADRGSVPGHGDVGRLARDRAQRRRLRRRLGGGPALAGRPRRPGRGRGAPPIAAGSGPRRRTHRRTGRLTPAGTDGRNEGRPSVRLARGRPTGEHGSWSSTTRTTCGPCSPGTSRLEGYQVDQAADAESVFQALADHPPDLVLLDVMLSPDDGLEVLSRIRKDGDVAVILLTGKGAEADRIVGLKLGADDYVVKPFSPAEVEARIASVLRRVKPPGSPVAHLRRALHRPVHPGGPGPRRAGDADGQGVRPPGVPGLVAPAGLLPRPAPRPGVELVARVAEPGHRHRAHPPPPQPDRGRRRPPRWITTVWGVGYRFNP